MSLTIKMFLVLSTVSLLPPVNSAQAGCAVLMQDPAPNPRNGHELSLDQLFERIKYSWKHQGFMETLDGIFDIQRIETIIEIQMEVVQEIQERQPRSRAALRPILYDKLRFVDTLIQTLGESRRPNGEHRVAKHHQMLLFEFIRDYLKTSSAHEYRRLALSLIDLRQEILDSPVPGSGYPPDILRHVVVEVGRRSKYATLRVLHRP